MAKAKLPVELPLDTSLTLDTSPTTMCSTMMRSVRSVRSTIASVASSPVVLAHARQMFNMANGQVLMLLQSEHAYHCFAELVKPVASQAGYASRQYVSHKPDRFLLDLIKSGRKYNTIATLAFVSAVEDMNVFLDSLNRLLTSDGYLLMVEAVNLCQQVDCAEADDAAADDLVTTLWAQGYVVTDIERFKVGLRELYAKQQSTAAQQNVRIARVWDIARIARMILSLPLLTSRMLTSRKWQRFARIRARRCSKTLSQHVAVK